MESQKRARNWGWLLAAAGGILIALAPFAFTVGSCADATVPGGSYCTSGPALGWPGSIIVAVIAGAFVIFAIVRLVIPKGSRPKSGA